MRNDQRDTWQNWVWWLFWGLIVASCVSYPLRWLFFPEFWGRLSWKQELIVFVITVGLLAVFVVKPFCKNMAKDD
jgi:hypothetical protein